MRRLVATGSDVDAGSLVAALELDDPGRAPHGRPRVVATMIASVDGRATVGGTSRALGHTEDRDLLRGVRAAADAVLAGTATIGAEGYARLLDVKPRARRVAAGRPAHPLVVTVTRSGDVPWDAPVFAEPDTPCRIFSRVPLTPPASAVGCVVTRVRDADLGLVLATLAADGVASVACEGGPALLRALLSAGLVDDLLLTVAPLLVAGSGPTSLAGDELAPPPRMRLADVHRVDDHLFLHYIR